MRTILYFLDPEYPFPRSCMSLNPEAASQHPVAKGGVASAVPHKMVCLLTSQVSDGTQDGH